MLLHLLVVSLRPWYALMMRAASLCRLPHVWVHCLPTCSAVHAPAGSCSVASQCPAPANGQPLCQSGKCNVACNNNFLKVPNPSGTGFLCTPVQPIGSLAMPGKFSVWVGGFSTVAGFNGERWDFR